MALTESMAPDGPHEESVAAGAEAFLNEYNALQASSVSSPSEASPAPAPDQGYKPDFAAIEAAAQSLREKAAQPQPAAEPVVERPPSQPQAPMVKRVKNTPITEGAASSLPNPDTAPFLVDINSRTKESGPVVITGAQRAGDVAAGILQPEAASVGANPMQEIKADTSIEDLAAGPEEVLFQGVRSATEAAADHAPTPEKVTVYDQDQDTSFQDKPVVEANPMPQDNARNREFAARINAELGTDFKKQVEFHAARDGVDLEQAAVQAAANEQAEKIAREDAKFIVGGKMNQLNHLLANIDPNTNLQNNGGIEGAVGLVGNELSGATWLEFREQLGSSNQDFYRTDISSGDSYWDYRIYNTGKPNTVMVEMRDEYDNLRGLYAVKTKEAPTRKTLFGRLTRRSEKQVPTKGLLSILFSLNPAESR